MPRIDGSAVYGKGDGAPFKIMVPPDMLAQMIEDAKDQDKFITVPSQYVDRFSEEVTERNIYVRPKDVWAIAPWLDSDSEDDE